MSEGDGTKAGERKAEMVDSKVGRVIVEAEADVDVEAFEIERGSTLEGMAAGLELLSRASKTSKEATVKNGF